MGLTPRGDGSYSVVHQSDWSYSHVYRFNGGDPLASCSHYPLWRYFLLYLVLDQRHPFLPFGAGRGDLHINIPRASATWGMILHGTLQYVCTGIPPKMIEAKIDLLEYF